MKAIIIAGAILAVFAGVACAGGGSPLDIADGLRCLCRSEHLSHCIRPATNRRAADVVVSLRFVAGMQ
jgi:hypothetical protein